MYKLSFRLLTSALIAFAIFCNLSACSSIHNKDESKTSHDIKVIPFQSKNFGYLFNENPTPMNQLELMYYLDAVSDYYSNNKNVDIIINLYSGETYYAYQKNSIENLNNQVISYLVGKGVGRQSIIGRYADIRTIETIPGIYDMIIEFIVEH